VNSFFRVGHGRCDYIPSAGPLPEIDGAAALAAKRELGISALHGFFADGAMKLE
jgi:hypothetical protein